MVHRPPGIYKQDYLEELCRRYSEVEFTPPAPELPDWCNGKERNALTVIIYKYRHVIIPY